MWYVMRTLTGREQELADMIDHILKKQGYRSCFVIYQEVVWRADGAFKVCNKPMFPSYVFVDTDRPDEFFYLLRRVPRLSRMLGSNGTFWTVKKEEQELLCKMRAAGLRKKQDPIFLIRRSAVTVDAEGNILTAEGPLKEFVGQIVKKRLRKRSVVIEIPFLGEKKRIALGIRVAGEEE